ncbi:MAG: deoxyribose-phosphate aldolase [Bacteroidales bacterium]|jgi:deoxyribose-phosphate aldolase|nr:deoxyribose-phosphate aldolase [Bacteroidales bacterium]
MYTKEQIAKTIDYAVLKPDQTVSGLEKHAKICIEYGVFSMCVKPCDIKTATQLLKNHDVKVSCVLSFPHGADTTPVKVFQAKQAIEDGTNEIDMVMNIGRFMSGNYEYVLNDIKSVVEIAKANNILVKVIQESGFLSPEQIAKACELSYEAGADFVKTSTGFGPGGAKPEYIDIMVKTVGRKMKIKASGGIREWETATAFLKQGVHRLGISDIEAVLGGRNRK